MKTVFAILVGGLAVAGCSNAGPTGYPISLDEAYQRLTGADLTDLLYHRRCGVPIKADSGGVPGKQVYWQVLSGGEERLRFTVTLTPVDREHTKVEVTEIKAREHDGEGYDGGRTYKRPVLEQPIRPAIEEQVAAILAGREYDKERAGRGDDSVCDVQRAGSESGSARFSVNNLGPDSVRDSRRDETWSAASSQRPGEPDPNAGKPSVRTW